MKYTPEQLLKRTIWLAFQASSPMGLGHLHTAAASAQTEDKLYASLIENRRNEGMIYTDYVFGRMMKTGFILNDTGEVRINPETPYYSYQSWGYVYSSGTKLVEAAKQSLVNEK